MTADDDDRFLEALAGRAEGTDHDTRHAARAHQLIRQRTLADDGRPVPADLLARLQRVNADIAQQVAQRQDRTAARPGPAATPRGGLAGLLAWLLPAGRGGGWRLAGAAAALGVVAAVVFQIVPSHQVDDSTQMKGSSLPGPAASATRPVAAMATVEVVDAQPVARATRLKAELKVLGVEARILAAGSSAVLDAAVTPEQQAAVQQLLKAQGIDWGGGPALSLQIKAAR